MKEPRSTDLDSPEYRRAMFLLNGVAVTQYLLSHTRSRMNGAVKAQMHRQMTCNYVATLRGGYPDSVQGFDPLAYAAIHDGTARELTSHLDREIGLNPDCHVSEEMVESFFVRFHQIALRAIRDLEGSGHVA